MKKYKIVMSNGTKTQDYCGDLSYSEALDICDNYLWIWIDDNDMIWDLDIVEDPDGFEQFIIE